MIAKTDFYGYEKYTIASDRLSVEVMTLGATVTSIKLDGKEFAMGFKTPKEYQDCPNYVGCIVGRYANRIAKSRFTLNGQEYILPANEGENQLHGGPYALNSRVWKAQPVGENSVIFAIDSPMMDNGYPGNLSASVTYTVIEDKLRIDFDADSDADTLYAPTTHLYFTVGGPGRALDTTLWMNASTYLAVDEELIPVGDPVAVSGAHDFRTAHKIGQDFDTFFVLDGEGKAAVCEKGGARMTIATDMPGLQLYTGQGLPQSLGAYCGFALEPAIHPNSPNRPDFPSPVLKRGDHYHKYIDYTFELL